MVGKIDNLFAPERLRGKWARKKESGKDSTNSSDNGITVIVEECDHRIFYNDIMALIRRRFSDRKLEILESLMDELQIQLNLKFDKTGKRLMPDEDISVIDTAIDRLLATVEDLVEVF